MIAVGRSNILAGAMAIVFHDSGGARVELDIGVGILKDQLWILYQPSIFFNISIGDNSGYTNVLPQMAMIVY